MGKISLTKRIKVTKMMKKKRRDSPDIFMAPQIIFSVKKRVLTYILASWRTFDDTKTKESARK
tara:strand:- start:635 stop:823 length:189 start_codon:yes stop_codon:yes gene_type:complete